MHKTNDATDRFQKCLQKLKRLKAELILKVLVTAQYQHRWFDHLPEKTDDVVSDITHTKARVVMVQLKRTHMDNLVLIQQSLLQHPGYCLQMAHITLNPVTDLIWTVVCLMFPPKLL